MKKKTKTHILLLDKTPDISEYPGHSQCNTFDVYQLDTKEDMIVQKPAIDLKSLNKFGFNKPLEP